MSMCKIAISILACLALASCNQTSKNKIYVKGRIDERFVARLLSQNTYGATIFLSSRGGLSRQAVLIAQNLRDNQNTLVISGDCISACAEYLLPAAKKVHLQKGARVGFHWNAMMIRHLYEKHATQNLEFCSEDDAKQLYRIQSEAGVNTNFWQETLKRLGNYVFTLSYSLNRCPAKIMEFENTLWYPTSQQLRELYGLIFTGSVCADDFKSCAQWIDRNKEKGSGYVIGDTVYVAGSYDDPNTRCKTRRRTQNYGLPFMRSNEKCEDKDSAPQ